MTKQQLRAIALAAICTHEVKVVPETEHTEVFSENGDKYLNHNRKRLRKIKASRVKALAVAHANGTRPISLTDMG